MPEIRAIQAMTGNPVRRSLLIGLEAILTYAAVSTIDFGANTVFHAYNAWKFGLEESRSKARTIENDMSAMMIITRPGEYLAAKEFKDFRPDQLLSGIIQTPYQ